MLAEIHHRTQNHDAISRNIAVSQEDKIVADRFAAIEQLAKDCPHFIDASRLGQSQLPAAETLPRYIFLGPRGGGDPIPIGIFAGIHGDEPEGVLAALDWLRLLAEQPALAEGYCFYVYPLCNPSGFHAGTRESRNGLDLNREFWRGSAQPEVQVIEAELEQHRFQGLIALHTDDTSDGFYGYASGATLSEHLLAPALAAASQALPLNRASVIDGFPARDGIIRSGFPGVLHGPPEQHPQPFDLIFETPRHAPLEQKEQALMLALRTALGEYQKFMAYAANL
jgi:hypothetical protein